MADVNKSSRLYFIDAIRSWAILMILQGHFIGALLSNRVLYSDHIFFSIWDYFRGVTAPVFFTVSGFIFTFLLLKSPISGWQNPRVLKGLKRGGQLIVIGYLLQLHFFGLINKGTFNSAFNIVHVLQCIGVSLILIIIFYLLFHRIKYAFPIILCATTLLLFLFETVFLQKDYSFMPELFSNYFTTTDGSVFTIIPWFGFASFGAFLSTVFVKNQHKPRFYLYTTISMFLGGILFILVSFKTPGVMAYLLGNPDLGQNLGNSYLFLRLGDVLLVFTFFILFRSYFKNPLFLKIGQHTLPIYVLHSIILYGSFTGLGLNRYFYHSLTASQTLVGAISFTIGISLLAILIEKSRLKYLKYSL